MSVVIAILAFLVLTIVVVVPHEAGHAIVAKLLGVKVEEFAVGFWKTLYSRKIGGTKFALRAIPLGGFVRLDDKSLAARGPFVRLCITLAGPFASIVFGGIVFALVFVIGMPALTAKIGQVAAGSPAERAGLKPGDEIVAVMDANIAFWDDVRERLNEFGARYDRCAVRVRRNGEELWIVTYPEKLEVEDVFGDKVSRYTIGIMPVGEVVIRRRGLFEAIATAGEAVVEGSKLVVRSLGKLFTGKIAPSEAMGGPIAIAHLSKTAAEIGLSAFLHLIGIISIMLGVVNLLPLPIVDGGQAVVAGVECVRGKPLGPTTEQILNYVGLAMIVWLFAYAMYVDIWKLSTGQSLIGK